MVTPIKSKHRIFFHDFGAYQFLFSLTKELAETHEKVTHAYVELLSVSRNAETADSGRESNYRQLPVEMDGDYQAVKYSFPKRFSLERAYGRKLAEAIRRERPSIVISSNAPTHVQSLMQKAANDVGAKFVFWVQDLYGEAVASVLTSKFSIAGAAAGMFFKQWERRLILKSDHIVVISEAFREPIRSMGCLEDSMTTVENWADLERYPVRAQENEWSRQQGLAGKFCFMYSGTMGLKHNPELLLELAKVYRDNEHVRVVVIAEGPGADFLQEQASVLDLGGTLIVLPFQPIEVVQDVLATSSVLIATLHPDAGHYCVPSKVLSYLCAGRPLLLAMPFSNPAAQITQDARAGFCCEPDDLESFLEHADCLLNQSDGAMGANARKYAEAHFDVRDISTRVNVFLN
ncbi:MAG: glycosyltransferase family 4 protein [Verrucomicrobiota bacterium]